MKRMDLSEDELQQFSLALIARLDTLREYKRNATRAIGNPKTSAKVEQGFDQEIGVCERLQIRVTKALYPAQTDSD